MHHSMLITRFKTPISHCQVSHIITVSITSSFRSVLIDIERVSYKSKGPEDTVIEVLINN